jgi:hypothetical protein
MKMKSLLVVTFLVLGFSLVSAQTFGFASASGAYLYCNYEQLTYVGNDIWEGIDNTSVCGGHNSTLVGFGATTPNKGQLAFGKGVVLADNLYDAYSYAYTGAQAALFTKLKCNKLDQGHYKGAPGWITVSAISGFVFGDNYGYLSCTVPKAGDRAAMSRGPAAGRMPARQKK